MIYTCKHCERVLRSDPHGSGNKPGGVCRRAECRAKERASSKPLTKEEILRSFMVPESPHDGSGRRKGLKIPRR